MQFRSISQGDGKLEPMGVEWRVCRTWSIDVPVGLVVVSEALRVLICLSMNPLDFG